MKYIYMYISDIVLTISDRAQLSYLAQDVKNSILSSFFGFVSFQI